MGAVKPIRNENDYDAAISRVDELMSAEPGSPEGEAFDALADLIEMYEREHVPMGYPEPETAIEFRMEQAGSGA